MKIISPFSLEHPCVLCVHFLSPPFLLTFHQYHQFNAEANFSRFYDASRVSCVKMSARQLELLLLWKLKTKDKERGSWNMRVSGVSHLTSIPVFIHNIFGLKFNTLEKLLVCLKGNYILEILSQFKTSVNLKRSEKTTNHSTRSIEMSILERRKNSHLNHIGHWWTLYRHFHRRHILTCETLKELSSRNYFIKLSTTNHISRHSKIRFFVSRWNLHMKSKKY